MIVLHESEDRFHKLTAPGSYEWSYFDGLSPDGEWGFVAIWFRGIPMSPYYTAAIDRHLRGSSPPPDPNDYCAFNLSVFHRGRRVFHVLHERPGDLFEGSETSGDVRLGANTAFVGSAPGGGRTFILSFDTRLPRQKSRLVGDIEIAFRRQDLGGLTSHYDPTAARHFWVPAALDGRFTARLDAWRLGRGTEKMRFTGRAYHDRNFGLAPLHQIDGDWQWGRLHAGPDLFVYFLVTSEMAEGREEASHAILLTDGTIATSTSDIHSTAGPLKRHWATLSYPTSITGESREKRLRFTAAHREPIESGPFYHRFLSEMTVDAGEGKVIEGLGIGEYLRPSRLGVAAFRPFVKFRMRRG